MASEIRVDKINSLSGVGTVTLSPTGIEISGITTVATLKATTGIVTTLTATTGIVTTLTASTVTSLGDVDIADKIVHTGDTNTAIRFPSADTITAETGGSERLRIDSSGNFGVGTNNPAAALHISNSVAEIRLTDSDGDGDYSQIISGATGNLFLSADAGNGGNDSRMSFLVDNTERLRISSTGQLSVNTTADVTGVNVAIGGSMRFVNATGQSATITALPSGTYNTGVSGGSAIVFHRFSDSGGGSDEIAFETHHQGTRHGEAARFNKSGNLAFPSGQGIDFSATSDASGKTSELLDDYEEGTWTPSLNGVTEPSWAVQVGTYTKIGSLVHLDMWLQATSTTTSTSAILIDLPFAASNVNASRPTSAVARVYALRNWSTYRSAFGFVTSGSSDMNMMWVSAGANPGSMNMNIWQNGAELHASITYNTHQ
jgi:hypothetical protein